MSTQAWSICRASRLIALLLFALQGVGGQTLGGVEPEPAPMERAKRDEAPPKEETPEERIVRLKRELLQAEEAAQSKAKEKKALSTGDIPSGALVVVSSEQSEGSGFIGTMKGRTFFITNIHVLGAARGARVTTVDGVGVPLGTVAFLSKRRDIAIVPITWDGPVLEVSPSLKFDEVKIGDAVTVMGNSSGAQVATRLSGKVDGLGPQEIEVSAKFVPGNSGSPIVHDALGTVVGVASHMRDLSAKTKWTEDSELADIRRFGYRLDGEIEWEQVSLSELYRQAEIYSRFEDRTFVLGRIGYMLENKSILMTNYREHASLGYMFDEISADFSWNRGTNSAHNQMLLERFIDNMVRELQSDWKETEEALTISFYKKSFYDIESLRGSVQRGLRRFRDVRL